jgi:hypothetical protein
LLLHIAAEVQFEAVREQGLEHLGNLTLLSARASLAVISKRASFIHSGPSIWKSLTVGGTNALSRGDVSVPDHAHIDIHPCPHLASRIGIKRLDLGDFEDGFVCGLLGQSEAERNRTNAHSA